MTKNNDINTNNDNIKINNDDYYFSCLNFNNEERKKKIEERFKILDINYNFNKGVNFDDDRIKNVPEAYKRVFSCTYGHLDGIYNFYHNTNKKYGIFCEDDIKIHKSLKQKLNDIMNEVDIMKLDILLLGYLTPHEINENNYGYSIKHHFENKLYKYYNYPDNQWGAQLFLITRNYAKYLLETFFYTDYAKKTISDTNLPPFSADWILTKHGNKALIYPMLAVEDGNANSGHYGQDKFHIDCHNFNINENFV
jgi:GR25 family glycosyltransferase involved in LPS biosynthesis